jgi:hypothetical protein
MFCGRMSIIDVLFGPLYILKVNGIIGESSDVQATMILEQHGLPMSILQYSSVPHTSRCRHLHGLPPVREVPIQPSHTYCAIPR